MKIDTITSYINKIYNINEIYESHNERRAYKFATEFIDYLYDMEVIKWELYKELITKNYSYYFNEVLTKK